MTKTSDRTIENYGKKDFSFHYIFDVFYMRTLENDHWCDLKQYSLNINLVNVELTIDIDIKNIYINIIGLFGHLARKIYNFNITILANLHNTYFKKSIMLTQVPKDNKKVLQNPEKNIGSVHDLTSMNLVS